MKVDKLEENERELKKELTAYLFLTENRIVDLNHTLMISYDQLIEAEMRVKSIKQFIIIVEKMIEISDILKRNNLTKEERQYYIQQKENLLSKKERYVLNGFRKSIEFYKQNPQLIPKPKGEKRPRGIFKVFGKKQVLELFVVCILFVGFFGSILALILYSLF